MLKFLLLIIIPGFFAELWRMNFYKKEPIGKHILNGILFGYILFMLDITWFFLFFREHYTGVLAFLQRRIPTIQDTYRFLLFGSVQVIMAFLIGLSARIIKEKDIEKAFIHLSAIQKKCSLAVVSGLIFVTVIVFAVKENAEQQLFINEVCSRNDKILTDETGEYSDYIEIYNASPCNILLKDFQLADNVQLNDSICFGEIVLPAKEYYLVWTNAQGDGFSISAKGESIYLANKGGKLLDTVSIPALDANMAYARVTSGNNEWMVEVPSPMMANDPLKKRLDKPIFSAESGFYDEAFLLKMDAGEGEKIYYTLDGSIPNESSHLYSEQILVENPSGNPNVYRDVPNVILDWTQDEGSSAPAEKAFIIRAIAVDDYGNTSDVVTKTYFVDLNHYRNQYVLSLISDPEDLFGDNGIYVTGKEYDDWYLGGQEGNQPVANFLKKGRAYEIDTTVALFHNELLMEQDAGLRIQGASQRYNAGKRFSVYARKEYSGSRYFEYNLFGKQMHSFFMRPDFIDALIQKLVSDRSIGTLQAVPVTVFLDGEFWYNSILREKYNEDYLSATYEVESKDVYLIEGIPQELYQFLSEHDVSQDADYEMFCNMVDIQSYIDYLATNIYVCNMDSSESKNCRMWKTLTNSNQGYNDGRWRFLIYDTDSVEWNSIGYYGALRADIDSFAQDKEYAGVAYNRETVYKALRTNKDFCEQFVLTFMDLANVNFAVDRVEKEIAKWGRDMSWNDGFFANRFDSIVPALAKEFELTGTLEPITLKVSQKDAGYVTINTTTPTIVDGNWTGKYYTDYPVTITAIANAGYEFVGWQNGQQIINEAQISVQLESGGCTWEAVFKKKEK